MVPPTPMHTSPHQAAGAPRPSPGWKRQAGRPGDAARLHLTSSSVPRGRGAGQAVRNFSETHAGAEGGTAVEPEPSGWGCRSLSLGPSEDPEVGLGDSGA